jgi:hypothetical protein
MGGTAIGSSRLSKKKARAALVYIYAQNFDTLYSVQFISRDYSRKHSNSHRLCF